MSAAEVQPVEQHSSVSIAMTAKGEATVTVKAYTHDLVTLDAAREKAVAVYNETVRAVRN